MQITGSEEPAVRTCKWEILYDIHKYEIHPLKAKGIITLGYFTEKIQKL